MGLGKTLQSLLWARQNWKTCRPIIVVCPASLKWNWQREAAFHVGMASDVLEGMKPPIGRRAQMFLNEQLLIINYDILSKWLPFLCNLQPQLIILDECHYIASRSAKRTKAVKILCDGVPHVIAMSGTPLTNRPSELFPTLNILRPDLFPSFFAYATRYCAPRRRPWGWEFKGASHLKELHEKLSDNLMIRRLKADVLDQLPAKSRYVVPLDFKKREEYDEAVNDFLSWLIKVAPKKVKRAMKAERLVKMGYLKRLAARLKMDAVFHWIDDFLNNSDGKIILFGVHTKILDTLEARYGHISVRVDGGVVGKRRQMMFDKFRMDKKTRIFIGNIDAAGTGWNGTIASTVAFVELSWTPGKHTQAEDRIHRIGQKNAAQCFYLIARLTIEEDLCQIIQQKQKVLSATLDGGEGDDLDIFDQLTKNLLGK